MESIADPREWNDRDFSDLRQIVAIQGNEIEQLKASLGRIELHMQNQSKLLSRIFVAVTGAGAAALFASLVFIAEHLH